jgi:hypothetical protein
VTPTLSEVEATALKAARGAGMSWGMAEEAAFAARWLAAHGIDGLTLLAHHLTRPTTPPTFANHSWRAATGGHLCPIAAGTALSDHFHLPEGPLTHPVDLLDLSAPALILPFMASAAARSGTVVIAQWSGCTAVLTPGSVALAGRDHLLTDHATRVTITAAQPQGITTHPGVAAATEYLLQTLVQRTYVPASAQSRRGAGASGTDNS